MTNIRYDLDSRFWRWSLSSIFGFLCWSYFTVDKPAYLSMSTKIITNTKLYYTTSNKVKIMWPQVLHLKEGNMTADRKYFGQRHNSKNQTKSNLFDFKPSRKSTRNSSGSWNKDLCKKNPAVQQLHRWSCGQQATNATIKQTIQLKFQGNVTIRLRIPL